MSVENAFSVNKLDNFAVSQVERLEHSMPIIAKPTPQLLQEVNGLYGATLKPSVDKITNSYQHVKSYSPKKVGDCVWFYELIMMLNVKMN